MINSWSLLYEELNGTMDKTYPIKETSMSGIGTYEKSEYYFDYTRNDPNRENPFIGLSTASDNSVYYTTDHLDFDSITIDTSNYTGVDLGTHYEHHYPDTPSIEKTSIGNKYEEDKSLKAVADYVSSTYNGHYTSKANNVQTLDLIESVGDAEAFCRSNAIKYLSRYDKRGQAKRDILKAMHYCLLLYFFSGNTQDEITTRGYETF